MGYEMVESDGQRPEQVRSKRRSVARTKQNLSGDCAGDGDAVERAYCDGIKHARTGRLDSGKGTWYATYDERTAFRIGWMVGMKDRKC